MRFFSKNTVHKTIILAIVSVLTIFIIFKTLVSVDDFFRIIKGVNRFYFFLSFVAIIPVIAVNSIKWYLLVRAAGFHVSLKKIFKIIITSSSLGILPGRLGDFARSYPLRQTIPVSQSVGTIILEKIIDISVLLAFSGVGLFILGYGMIAVFVCVLAIIGIPSLTVVDILAKKILPENGLTEKLHDALSTLNKVKKEKFLFLTAILSSCINSALVVLRIYWLFKATGLTIPVRAISAFFPLSMFAGLIPVTLAGVGTRDSAIIYFFKDFASSEQSLAVGVLYGLQTYWIIALLGLPLLYYFFKQDGQSQNL